MFYVAVAVGIVFCSFWAAQLIFVKLHLNWTNRLQKSSEDDINVGVSVIHPIKDLDFELEKNLDSWFNQDYRGSVEHIFSFQEPEDPAINVVKSFIAKYPQVDSRIIVNPVMPGLNGKSSNMVNGMKLSKYDIVLFGDSDIRIRPDFILKMVRPLNNEKVGITTCGQINIGGRDFWTRFFTFLQNNETVFIWAFMTRIGMDLGATGAAFAMRKKLLKEVGGLETFGGSLLEDLHLGNTLYKMGYKLILGPFLECHVDKLEKEKSLNYAKRIAVGIKTHLAFELPTFVLMVFWYWIIFILAIVLGNLSLLYLSFVFMGLRTVQALMMRILTKNKILPVDLIMGLFFDLFGTFYLLYSLKNREPERQVIRCTKTFYLLYSLKNPFVSWRGIKYEVKKGGFIEDVVVEESVIKAETLDEQVKS